MYVSENYHTKYKEYSIFILNFSISGSPSALPENSDLFIADHCAPIFARHLYWNWTRSGDVAIQPCPQESTGLARWTCEPETLNFLGHQPDMSDCKSSEVSDLETRVREEDPENVIVSSLERLTEKGASKLYGGDLEAVVNVLKAVLNRLQYMLQVRKTQNTCFDNIKLVNIDLFFNIIFQ